MSVCDEGWSSGRCPVCFDQSYPYASRCGFGIWHQNKYKKTFPPTTCPHAPALHAVAENPELVLVAVPSEVESLVGWRKKIHEPIDVDPLTGCVTISAGRIRGPDTEMVWHWVREDDTLDPEVEETGGSNEV